MIQTQSGTWHLHIDGTRMNDAFRAWCEAQGFEWANFAGHPEDFEHFEPAEHLTVKLNSRRTFDELFAATCTAAEAAFVGYVEGEYISRVIEIPDQPFVDLIVPFHVERRTLRAEEQFREGEFHLTFDADHSDARRVEQLLRAGLYGAYEKKGDGRRYLVLTMQGYMRDVVRMTEGLETFLREAGGLVRARLKIERAMGFRLFGITTKNLPPIAGNIHWAS